MKYGSMILLTSVIYGSQKVRFWYYFSHVHKPPLNTHVDVLSRARGIFLSYSHLYLYFVYASLHICAGLHKPSLLEDVITSETCPKLPIKNRQKRLKAMW